MIASTCWAASHPAQADFLKRHKIDKALIAGVGPGVGERLKARGIERVLDITPERLGQRCLAWATRAGGVAKLAQAGGGAGLASRRASTARMMATCAGASNGSPATCRRSASWSASSTSADEFGARILCTTGRKAAEREIDRGTPPGQGGRGAGPIFGRRRARCVWSGRNLIARPRAFCPGRSAGRPVESRITPSWCGARRAWLRSSTGADAVDFPSYVRRRGSPGAPGDKRSIWRLSLPICPFFVPLVSLWLCGGL